MSAKTKKEAEQAEEAARRRLAESPLRLQSQKDKEDAELKLFELKQSMEI